MILNPDQLSAREKQILVGMFLSKFDEKGVAALGFDSFIEAFNALGYGLGGRPASIKNYRDEFDPLFPNKRKGWHKRPRRDYCVKLAANYQSLSLKNFARLVASFIGAPDQIIPSQPAEDDNLSPSSFAKRLITGRAAEQYFQAVYSRLPEFGQCDVEDTTMQGCGYDFRLWPKSGDKFRAVEVKGIADRSGWLSLTEKEHDSAAALGDRFYLFVVKNFREKPFHEMHANPLAGPLSFARKERQIVQVSWLAAA
ncbi:MAG: DUF3883 domain-containing protein [Prosthecobacter sp.]|uniref:DUF3883 domain-containing protein n=1 Tax=Prosthecobacter sp. TaxID=1965333 RepID=UPI0038FDCA1E